MMKIILRTLVILLVSGLVAGGIYAFAVTSGSSVLGAGERHGGFDREGFNPEGFTPPAGGDAAAFEGSRPPRGDHGDEAGGFSLIGLAGVAMQAAKIAVITAVVVLIQKGVRLLRRRRPTAQPA